MEYFTKIDQYCSDKSTPVSSICNEIEHYTKSHVPMSVMLVGPLEGSFLGFLASLVQAKRVLEIGCFTGYSALAMAERLPPDGELITLDINSETTEIAKKYWGQSTHGKKIRMILGPALESLTNLRGPFDLVFIDAAKLEYLEYLQRCLGMLSERGLIVADNALWQGEVLNSNTKDEGARAIQKFNDFVAQQRNLEKILLPIRDGMFLIRKLGSSL